MNYHKNKLILSGMLAILLSLAALALEPPAMKTEAVQLGESMDKSTPSTTQTEQQIKQQPEINQTLSSELYSKRPDELLDKKIRNSNEEVIGKIKAVVSSRQDGQVHVVIAKGGIMGIGASEYVVPLYSLSMNEGKVYLRSASGKNTLDQKYIEEAYVSIEPENLPISEFSAFEERMQ